MLYRLFLGVHPVNIDTGDSRVLRVIVEQIQEIHMRPDVFANRDDAVDDDAWASAFVGNLAKKAP